MTYLPTFIRRDWLDVGDGHQLHLAQYGDPDGVPILYLHGGPGAGCMGGELALFGDNCRVLMLDQRGSGRSKPLGEINSNNLLALLKDLEKVRLWLDIPAWCLVGGSFGATLGMLYSGLYPEKVLSQVYWGLFIPSEDGTNWLYSHKGAAKLFADEYLAFTALAPFCSSVEQLFTTFRLGFKHKDADTRHHYICAWLAWESVLAMPASQRSNRDAAVSRSLAEIELHYASHQYFGAYSLMREISARIQAPTLILQGEMDWVCPTQLVENFLIEFGCDSINYSVIKSGYHGLADDKMFQEVVYALRKMADNIKEI
ncbi:alpha/beta fold hydrolase [Shewanella violacea]|uniref:Proline iminopeptidase n=1 Tax=Shewanella violacea (strain JCM 10179 / CIP 106290 / LMG 19151 / DSS12) TaxID=637905 RepID=D4ZE22_SHEVD|nr:alpha/beta fold hydrolase [Shewanella violacea]BAJ04083.1 proline iminopeptidase, putative [Shewanella violacea DSS12]